MNALEWSPSEIFEISGYELETMVNLLMVKLQSPEAQKIIREYETLRMLQERIKKGIGDGKVKEITDANSELTV